jgi:hypothetical protein
MRSFNPGWLGYIEYIISMGDEQLLLFGRTH